MAKVVETVLISIDRNKQIDLAYHDDTLKAEMLTIAGTAREVVPV